MAEKYLFSPSSCESRVKARASVIVTFNLKDFPSDLLAPFQVTAVHPQEYLLTLFSMAPSMVVAKIAAIARDRGTDLQDVLIHLGKSVPAFASQILEEMGDGESWNRPSDC